MFLKANQCAYCLKELDKIDRTDDHVIARSWYPSDTPPVEKWKAPACRECNNKFSADESLALGRLALTLPKEPRYAEIIQRAMRAIDPAQGRNTRDAMRRGLAREALGKNVLHVGNDKIQGLLPYSRANFLHGSRTGIRIPAQPLENVVQKWVRGIHFCESGWPLPLDTEVNVFFFDDDATREAFSAIAQHMKYIQNGLGIQIARAHAEEGDDFGSLYVFLIWQRFKAYASADGRNVVDKSG